MGCSVLGHVWEICCSGEVVTCGTGAKGQSCFGGDWGSRGRQQGPAAGASRGDGKRVQIGVSLTLVMASQCQAAAVSLCQAEASFCQADGISLCQAEASLCQADAFSLRQAEVSLYVPAGLRDLSSVREEARAVQRPLSDLHAVLLDMSQALDVHHADITQGMHALLCALVSAVVA